MRPKRPAPARRSKKAEEAAADVLTAEEEYLLKVFRRYGKNPTTTAAPATTIATAAAAAATATATAATQKLRQSSNKWSPSPPKPKTLPLSNNKPVGGGGAAGAAAGKSSRVDNKPGSAAAAGSEASAAAALPVPRTEEKPAGAPMDAVSRAKMILEKKRKAAAGFGLSRVGSAASSGALRKAKITKVTGTPASNARLDPVKYPASGLLLRDEFRTFVEIENEGERVYEPVEPLVRLLRNFGIADSGSSTGIGKKQLYETLVMRVTVPPHSRSWGLNICPRDHKQFEEIIFHFNPRRRFVAMNHRDGNVWGQQEKYMLPRWPDMFNVSINVAVQIDRTGFHVAVDGKYCATFAHRTKLPSSGEELTLQVMTRDDYNTSLGLVVHEIWWGHKDTMPGLPGAVKEQTRYEFTDLHASNLPSMPTPEKEEAVRKRLLDMFQPYGAMQVRVLHRDSKNFGFVKFRQHSDAVKALEELDGAEVIGRAMRLSKAAAR
ncbi:unnamed protein product [Pylaiella littoralis]